MPIKTIDLDMCKGPFLKKILLFSFPLMLSGVLQLLFNAADIVVVGRFSGNTSLAAVGSTSSLVALFVGFLVGLSIGCCAITAKRVGEKKFEALSDVVHTSIAISLLFGVFLAVVSFIFSRPLLTLMGSPSDVIDKSVLYVKIYFAGIPFLTLYNFGASVLRGLGDTKRPALFLTIAGVINVVLNLFFVIVLKMDVAGVATATIISEFVSATLIVITLIRTNDYFSFSFKKIRIVKRELIDIAKIGIPAALQSVIFNITNISIQSSINSFGSLVMAANSAAATIDNFLLLPVDSVAQTALTFTSQNFGAKKTKNIKVIFIETNLIASVFGLVFGVIFYLLAPQLLSIFSNNPDIIPYGTTRLLYVAVPYFLTGMMNVAVATQRGLGQSFIPMIVSVVCICVFRFIWLNTVFATYHTIDILYLSYAVSWLLTSTVQFVFFLIKYKSVKNSLNQSFS